MPCMHLLVGTNILGELGRPHFPMYRYVHLSAVAMVPEGWLEIDKHYSLVLTKVKPILFSGECYIGN